MSVMQKVVQRLNDQQENLLITILGKLNVAFYFPEAWIDVNREGICVSSASIPTGRGTFVIINTAWADTLKDFLDVYYLDVTLAEKPRDITVTRDENGPSGWAFEHVSTINTFDWTILRKISIYEQRTVGQHEEVISDRALLFEYDKGQLLISAGGTLFDQLRINHKDEAIKEILVSLRLRKELSLSR